MPPGSILEKTALASAGSLGEYLEYLGQTGRWEALEQASARALAGGVDPGPEALRLAFEGLFQAGQADRMLRLWRLAGGAGDGFANGDLGRPLRGWGLDWVVWPTAGVEVGLRGGLLEIEFVRPQNIHYAGVTHDFPVRPGNIYRLRLEAIAEGIGSSEGVAVEVISNRRQLAVSQPLLRSTGWRTLELRFQPAADERLCRFRVVRRPSDRFDQMISGRFSLRRVRLEPHPGAGTGRAEARRGLKSAPQMDKLRAQLSLSLRS